MSKSQRAYVFTAWSVPKLNDDIRYMIYGEEKTSAGQIHYQGYAEFNRKITIPTFKKIIDDEKAHVEIRKGTRDQAKEYCKKGEQPHEEWNTQGPKGPTYGLNAIVKEHGDWNAGGQGRRNDLIKIRDLIEEGKTNYELIDEPEAAALICKNPGVIRFIREAVEEKKRTEVLKEQFEEVTLSDEQKEWEEHLDRQNDRQITWVVDKIGNRGKTWFSKYKFSQGFQRFENAKNADMAYALNESAKGFIFDFSRSQEDHINYGMIESIKNGIVFSPKYASCCKVFKIPKIICFSNFVPEMSKFSKDRWDIIILKPPNYDSD